MAGHGCLMTSKPPAFAGTGLPCLSTTSAMTPGSGLVQEPGFVGVAPGIGEIMIAPVSVCHQVSTIGQRFLPIVSEYHLHAAGLIGSPTEPISRRLPRLCGFTQSMPQAMKARIAVGEV